MGTPEAPVSRRERKKQQTRYALRDAALRLFATKGFERTTVEDITEAADVSPRTFFLHFASKEDVLLDPLYERLSAARAQLAATPPDRDPVELLRDMLRAMLSRLPEGVADRVTLLLQARIREDAARVLARMAERLHGLAEEATRAVAARTGEDPGKDLYPQLLVAVAMSALKVGLTTWYQRGGRDGFAALVEEAFDLAIADLRRPARARPRA